MPLLPTRRKRPAVPPPHSPASLLGLPPEIRLQIYDYVLALDCHHLPSRHFRKHFTHKASPPRHRLLHPHPHPEIPWLHLLSTSRLLRRELGALLGSAALCADASLHTYRLHLRPSPCGARLAAATWTQLPCPPEHAHHLVLDLHATDLTVLHLPRGRPSLFYLALLATLSFAPYYGPALHRRHQLRPGSYFDTLTVHVHDGADRDLVDVFTALLARKLGQWAANGSMHGSYGMVRLVARERCWAWQVEPRRKPEEKPLTRLFWLWCFRRPRCVVCASSVLIPC